MSSTLAAVGTALFSDPIFDTVYFGNELSVYVTAALVFIVGVSVFWVLQQVVIARLKKLAEKTKTDIDDTFIKIVQSVRPGFYFFVAFYIATLNLIPATLPRQIINGVLLVWVVYQVVTALHIFINYIFEKRAAQAGEGEEAKAAYGFLSQMIKWVLYAIGALLILSNLGVNITSLIAGLGIGGVAIAFALQNILADLFSSFAIYFDKPFQVGDFIVIGEHKGTIEKIGIKSTRIRALQGEEIVVSNQELTSTRIQNFRKLEERRISFNFGILYETPTDVVEKVPHMVKKIIEETPMTRFDRAHFLTFGDSSLDFEVVYYVLSREFNDYADTQQAINNELMKTFERNKIEFAYPTRVIYSKSA